MDKILGHQPLHPQISDLYVQLALFLREPQPKRAETKCRTHSKIQEASKRMKITRVVL